MFHSFYFLPLPIKQLFSEPSGLIVGAPLSYPYHLRKNLAEHGMYSYSADNTMDSRVERFLRALLGTIGSPMLYDKASALHHESCAVACQDNCSVFRCERRVRAIPFRPTFTFRMGTFRVPGCHFVPMFA